MLNKATALHHRYISKTNDYSESLLDHYEQYYTELAGFVKRIRDSLEDGVNRFGSDFEKPISAAEKLYGVFSDRYKEIVAAYEPPPMDPAVKEELDAFVERRIREGGAPSEF